MSITAALALYDDFCGFIAARSMHDSTDLLQDCVMDWLEEGDAVIESGGDFGVYVTALVVIIMRIGGALGPASLGEPSSSIPALRVGPLGDGVSQLWLDSNYFRTVLMRRLAARRCG